MASTPLPQAASYCPFITNRRFVSGFPRQFFSARKYSTKSYDVLRVSASQLGDGSGDKGRRPVWTRGFTGTTPTKAGLAEEAAAVAIHSPLLEEIKAVYRWLSKEYYPDTTSLPLKASSDKFLKLWEVYDVLSNEETRRFYDCTLVQEAASRQAAKMRMRQARGPVPAGLGELRSCP